MKVLYAASNRFDAVLQMERFLTSIDRSKYEVKIAAYKNAANSTNIDYTLDALLNTANPKTISFNGNYSYYANEIKRFAPDIVISDFDIYTSLIALDLNVKLWQFSSSILFYALKHEVKYNTKLHRTYWHNFDASSKKNSYVQSIINNSERRFVVSHIGDSTHNDILSESFEWVRPNFVLDEGSGKASRVLFLPRASRKDLDEFSDCVAVRMFDSDSENYTTINARSQNYGGYLGSCDSCVADGTPSFLADAFYNQKYCVMYPKYDDFDCVAASFVNEYCGLGHVSSFSDNKTPSTIDILLNNKVKFMSEHLGEV